MKHQTAILTQEEINALWEEYNNGTLKWVEKPVKDMTDSHLTNAINKLKSFTKQSPSMTVWINILQTEYDKREKKTDKKIDRNVDRSVDGQIEVSFIHMVNQNVVRAFGNDNQFTFEDACTGLKCFNCFKAMGIKVFWKKI